VPRQGTKRDVEHEQRDGFLVQGKKKRGKERGGKRKNTVGLKRKGGREEKREIRCSNTSKGGKGGEDNRKKRKGGEGGPTEVFGTPEKKKE